MPILRRSALVFVLFIGSAHADDASIKKAAPVATTAPTLIVSAGASFDNRDLTANAENVEGVTRYVGVPNRGATFDIAYYPISIRHGDKVSSFGVSFAAARSFGSKVTVDDGEMISDLKIDQSSWNAGAHYRVATGRVSFDAELGLGHTGYALRDAPADFEVPDTSYGYVSAGGRGELDIYRGITFGVGARYLHGTGDAGDLTNEAWYGPGQITGAGVDATLLIPLPQHMFVRAKVASTTLTTKLDGVGMITEDEGVVSTNDTTTSAGLAFGVRF